MGRKPGSKNAPRDPSAPKRTRKKADAPASNGSAGLGHNRPELTPDEKRVLLVTAIEKIVKVEDALKEHSKNERAKIKQERKRLFADGFAAVEVDYALLLARSTDAEVLDRRKREADVARWLGHAVGHQADMFGDGVDCTPGVDAAFENGKNAGIKGDTCKVPDRWSEASEQGQRWMEGWHEGQKLLMSDGIKLLTERHNDESKDVEDDVEGESGEVLPNVDDTGDAGYELRH